MISPSLFRQRRFPLFAGGSAGSFRSQGCKYPAFFTSSMKCRSGVVMSASGRRGITNLGGL